MRHFLDFPTIRNLIEVLEELEREYGSSTEIWCMNYGDIVDVPVRSLESQEDNNGKYFRIEG